MTVEKRALLTATFILMLLFSAVVGTQFINLGKANPNYFNGTTAPPADAKPPTITIFSFKNNTIFTINNVILNFTVFVGKSTTPYGTYLPLVYCETSWLQEKTASWLKDKTIAYITSDYTNYQTSIGFSRNLTNIPDGSHSITIYATERGFYLGGSAIAVGKVSYVYDFAISNFWIINFTVDTTTPKVSILSLENKTYDTSDIPLNFIVNESVSQITYSLDGQNNVTGAGNITLTGLSNGERNITVYATDIAGHIGASETIYFSVEVPFPTAFVATASGASVAVIGIGLLVYFKKRKHKKEMVELK